MGKLRALKTSAFAWFGWFEISIGEFQFIGVHRQDHLQLSLMNPWQDSGANLSGLAFYAPLFHVMTMQSHELLREVFQDCSPKQVAAELNLSLSMIYKWAEPPENDSGSGSNNPLDRIEALIHCSKDERIVQWLCQRCGGFFIRNPKNHHPHPDFLIPATNEIVQEFADLLAVIATAAGDNQITAGEARKIRARWEELKCVTEGFVACCEQGNFAPLREQGE
jgi:hypothetical protein